MEGVRRWFRLWDVERDVDDEIGLYFEEAVRELEATGLGRAAAREEAERRFGDARAYRRALVTIDQGAQQRRRWGSRFDSGRDVVRYAVRSLLRAPALTVGIVLAFALGIGANATMYATVERLLLRPPPHIAEPDAVRRLLVHRQSGLGDAIYASTVAYPDYLDFAKTSGFSHVSATNAREVTLGSGEGAERVSAVFVNANYWDMLGVRPALGRFFTAEEDRFGAAGTAVLSFRTWQNRYGGRADVVGQTLDFGYGPFTIVGVTPKGFTGHDLRPVDFFAPFLVAGEVMQGGTEWAESRGWYWHSVIARLAPGASAEAAESEATTHHRLGNEGNEERRNYDTNARVVAAPLLVARGPNAPSEVAVARWLLGVAVIVLLIACLNVANLLLARMIRQRREVSIRLALGISRLRLIGQIFAEGVVLGLMGGAAALLLTYWGGAYVQRTLLPDVDWGSGLTSGVALVVAGLAVLSGLMAAVVPAIQTSRRHVIEGLRVSSGGITRSTARVRGTLSAVQAALSVILLVGAGLFVRSLNEVKSGDFGIDPWNSVFFSAGFTQSANLSREERTQFYANVIERVAAVPGVEAVGAVAGVPFWSAYAYTLRVPGRDSIPRTSTGGPYGNVVSPGYFSAVGLDVVRGRTFDDRDSRLSDPVVVLSESFARALWPAGDAVGQCMHINDSAACVQIVGLVEDASRGSLIEDVTYQYYVSTNQSVIERSPDGLIVRAREDVPALIAAVRKELLAADPRMRFVRAVPLTDMIASELRRWHLGATLFSVFGALALIVAAIGLYSVLAFDVAQRVREIGLRSALGASTTALISLVLSRGLRIALIGIAAGTVVALALAPRLGGMLYGIEPRDPVTFIAVIGMLAVVALAAGLIPAWRAARVDPNVALRAD